MLLVMLTVFTLFCSCENVNPVINQEKDDKTDSAENIVHNNGSDNEEKIAYTAYGDGMEHIETVKGVEVNADEYALRAFELVFLMAQKSFSKIEDIPVDVLVQYAFCHLFFDNLYEMPHEGVVYKDAQLSEIKAVVEKYFGKNNIDLKKSVLYNSGKKKFEMWQPGYGTDVYYTINSVEVNDSDVLIDITFFNEKEKATLKGYVELTLQVKNKKIIMSKLDSRFED